MKNSKRSFFGVSGKFTAIALLTAAVLIAINLIIGGVLPGIDISEKGLFTLSDATKDSLAFAKGITMYMIGDEDTANLTVVNTVKAFEKASSGIKLDYLTAEEAAYYTSSEVADADIIVTNGELSVLVESADAYGYVYDTDENGNTTADVEIKLEGQLLTAVEEISGEHKICYLLQGHAETEPGDGFKQELLALGYQTRDLYLNETKAMPDDCSMVMINAPQTDIYDIEAELLKEFLDNGGIILLTTDGQYGVGEYLSSVTEHAGMETVSGLIIEDDASHLIDADYPYYLLCDYAENSTGYTYAIPALMAVAHGIDITEADGYTAFPVLETSESAFNKPSAYSDGVFTYAEGDDKGKFCTAACAISANGEGGMLWFASPQCLVDGIDEMVYGSNYELASAYLQQLGAESVQFTQVENKSATESTIAANTVLPAVMIAIPVAMLIVGIVISAEKSSAKTKDE